MPFLISIFLFFPGISTFYNLFWNASKNGWWGKIIHNYHHNYKKELSTVLPTNHSQPAINSLSTQNNLAMKHKRCRPIIGFVRSLGKFTISWKEIFLITKFELLFWLLLIFIPQAMYQISWGSNIIQRLWGINMQRNILLVILNKFFWWYWKIWI